LGLGLGILLAGFLEYRDTSIKTDSDVVATLMLPVLAVIPELTTSESELAKTRQNRYVLGLGLAVALLVIVLSVWAILR
jgi:Mn2+/Fe2+ NRAMP family transporter